MTSRYTIDIKGQCCLIRDNLTEGCLHITNQLSEEYLNNLGDNDLNPLVDFCNDLQEEIDNHKVSLELLGDDNFITFPDTDVPVLQGTVSLRNVNLYNPFINNSIMENVMVTNVEGCIFSHCDITGFTHNFKNSEDLHLSHCFINGQYSIDNSAERTEFLMNICRNGEMW